MTASSVLPVSVMQVRADAPKEVWTLHVTDDGRRLSIVPRLVEVHAYTLPRLGRRYGVTVSGSVVRQSDGVRTTNRRAVSFIFDDEEQTPGWPKHRLSETRSLDPEIVEFALDARRRIDAALGLAVAS